MKIFTSQNLVEVEALKSRLEQEGISCFIKNQFTALPAGAVPFAELFPELWVTQVKDAGKAQELLKQWAAEGVTAGPAWTCDGCGERHEGQFTTCWKCGAERGRP